MLRPTLALLGVASAAAWPPSIHLPDVHLPDVHMPDLFGSGCTGSEIKDTPPACFSGKASILGGAFSENVMVVIKTFDSVHQSGTLDIHATGASPEDCHDLPFKKNGQKVTYDTGCLSGTQLDTEFCADQDKVMLHVSIPHMPVGKVPVSLARVQCPA